MDLQQTAKKAWFQYYPGILVAFVIAATATFLSEHYGAPVMLFALLIGIAFHFLTEAPKCEPGIDFAAKRLLKIGIALLGVRITFADLSSLGATPVLAVLGLIVMIICVGVVV